MWRRWLAILAVAAFAIVAIALVEIFSLAAEGQPHGAAQAHNQYQPVYASLVQLLLGGWNRLRHRVDHDTIGTLAIVATACFTGTLWWSTKRLWESSIEHSVHMESSVSEANRTATAMERVAAGITANTENTRVLIERQRQYAQSQMRAYLTIYSPQIGLQNIVEAIPAPYTIQMFVLNSGNTPAHDFNFYAAMDVLPIPLPNNHAFIMPENEFQQSGHINPRQQFFFRRNLDQLLWPDEVTRIRFGNGVALYIYGQLRFRDAFGDPHHTNFCQFCDFRNPYNLGTFNTPQHNDAT